jgi:hypothetical protein
LDSLLLAPLSWPTLAKHLHLLLLVTVLPKKTRHGLIF